MDRRGFLMGLSLPCSLALSGPFALQGQSAERKRALKITAVELLELSGHRETETGVNAQYQVNPLDVYDELRRPEYHDKAPVRKTVPRAKTIYLRIRTDGSADGLYGPIDREAAIVVYEQLRPFLIGKDALAGEAMWDEMYRSNRHSRDGIFMMAISAVDNTLWDLRGRYFNVPVYRLLGGPTRPSIEVYGSCLGYSLEPEKVKERCLALKNEGFRYQKWFLAYGPASGPEGLEKNVELVRILRETLGNSTEIMFDSFSGWDVEVCARMGRTRGAIPPVLDGGVHASGKNRELRDPASQHQHPRRFRRTLLWTLGSGALFTGGRSLRGAG